MAAPTDLRVEALSITSAILRWVYPGTASIAVFRSTDGISYAEITSLVDNTRVLAGTTSYTDVGLATGTKYWYKLSDDAGATFSSVVTVFTQSCGEPPVADTDVILPRAGEEVLPVDFNDLAIRVETGLVRFTNPDGRTCTACINDGALVIDCVDFTNCEIVEVEVDQEIRSISIPNCENALIQIDFLVPPGVTRGICGWPGGAGFGGDECFRAPIVGGTDGRRVSVPTRQGASTNSTLPKSKKGYTRGGGGGGVGGGCTCVPNGNGALTIKSCTAGNSLSCSGGKSLQLKACGGLAPYSWSKTGSITLSAATGDTITVTPNANTGSGVAGVAYTKNVASCVVSSGSVEVIFTEFGCNDVQQGGNNAGSTASALVCPVVLVTCDNIPECRGTDALPGNCSCGTPFPGTTGVSGITYCTPNNGGYVCDKRTAGMVSAGCEPCGLKAGSTVSVTDSLGTVTTIILKA